MPQPCFTLSFERLRPCLQEGTEVSMAAGLSKEISGHIWDCPPQPTGAGRGCKPGEVSEKRMGRKAGRADFHTAFSPQDLLILPGFVPGTGHL